MPSKLLVSLIPAVFLAVTAAHAQENQGTIAGGVSDPAGGAVPGATVEATNIATGVSTSARTDSTGQYSIPFLQPGTYRVTVTAQGFSEAVGHARLGTTNDENGVQTRYPGLCPRVEERLAWLGAI